jgi:hypothetical protein
MRTYRWLTLAAAILITALEIWAFTGASASTSAAQPAPPTTALMGNRGSFVDAAQVSSERTRLK